MSSIDFSLGGANFSIPTSELKREAEAEGKLVKASFFSDLLAVLERRERKAERRR